MWYPIVEYMNNRSYEKNNEVLEMKDKFDVERNGTLSVLEGIGCG